MMTYWTTCFPLDCRCASWVERVPDMRFCSDNAASSVLAWIAVLLACAPIPLVGQAQAPSPGVFSTFQTDLIPDISLALEPATMRSRVVGVDSQQLTAARLGQETLRLNLFDDVAVAVRIDRVRPTRSGYFITGRPQGFEWGEVRLVVNGPVTVGTVVTPEGKYTIRYGGAGRHIVREVDPSAELLEDDVVESPLSPGPPQGTVPGETQPATPLQGITPGAILPAGPLPSGPPRATAPGDPLGAVVRPAAANLEDQPTEDGSEVRVMIVYTPAMQAQQGGAVGMQALIDLMIESANHAFEVSGIDPRLLLAHTALVNYVEVHTHTDLDRLAKTDDGYMDEIHDLRNEHAADLVHLLAFGGSGPAGSANRIYTESLTYPASYGFTTENAFAVTANGSEQTFTHEIGHNFGLRHDRYVSSLHTTIYPYAFGYVNNRAFESGAPVTARWSTIMAYGERCFAAGFACPRQFRFSNPDQTYMGDRLGVPADDPAMGPEGPADARLTINRTARWVASFRSEACTQFAVLPANPVAPLDGGEVVLEIDTTPGCLWEVSSQSGFLAPLSEPRQAGPRFISISVEANETGAERVGALTVAGRTIEIRQLVTDAGICSRSSSAIRGIEDAISGTGYRVSSCDQVTADHLARIKTLRWQRRGLTSLKAGDFEGLSQLQNLGLSGNRLTEVPEGLFAGLTNLTYLILSGNQLAELPAGLFAGLSKLRVLHLDGNALEELPPGLFSGLLNLEELWLTRTRLSDLPSGVFVDLERLEDLRLDYNELAALPDGMFIGLERLKKLNLSGNQLTVLPSRPFAELSELEELNLFSNQLTELGEDAFAGLTGLQKLDLGNNPMTTLPPGVFAGLANLQELKFWGIEFTSLPEDIFAGLSNLEHLLLYSNRMPQLPSGLLAGLTRLNKLFIGGIAVTMLPEGLFSGLNGLKDLEVSLSKTGSLPDGIFSGLTLLEAVKISRHFGTGEALPLTVTLESAGDGQFKAVAPTGVPFTVEFPLTVSEGGEVAGGSNTVTIPVGAVESVTLSVTQISSETEIDTATVDIAALPPLPENHSGYVFEVDPALPLEISLTEDVSPPAQVTGVAVTRGRMSLQVSWTPVSGTDGYKVQWKSGDEDYDAETRQAVIAGGDTVGYAITGLMDGTGYTVRVLATRAGADDGPFSDEVGATTRSGDPDVNGDGVLDGDDAQIMYYAYRFARLVGDGETGGTEASRQRFLAGYSGLVEPSDEDLRGMVAKAAAWREEGLDEGGDINADGAIDGSDARAMNYAYRYESLLGDGEEGGAARFRLQLLGPLAGKADPTDEELKAMLRRANELREAYS